MASDFENPQQDVTDTINGSVPPENSTPEVSVSSDIKTPTETKSEEPKKTKEAAPKAKTEGTVKAAKPSAAGPPPKDAPKEAAPPADKAAQEAQWFRYHGAQVPEDEFGLVDGARQGRPVLAPEDMQLSRLQARLRREVKEDLVSPVAIDIACPGDGPELGEDHAIALRRISFLDEPGEVPPAEHHVA